MPDAEATNDIATLAYVNKQCGGCAHWSRVPTNIVGQNVGMCREHMVHQMVGPGQFMSFYPNLPAVTQACSHFVEAPLRAEPTQPEPEPAPEPQAEERRSPILLG